jgi:hypothetical protein
MGSHNFLKTKNVDLSKVIISIQIMTNLYGNHRVITVKVKVKGKDIPVPGRGGP